LEYCVKKNLYI